MKNILNRTEVATEEYCKCISKMFSLDVRTVMRLYLGKECRFTFENVEAVSVPVVRGGIEGHMVVREAHERFVPLKYHNAPKAMRALKAMR